VRAFEFEDGSADTFVDRVRAVLADRGLTDHVDLQRDGRLLVVSFRWMGSSELRYRVSEGESGFRAELDGERISVFHTPFKQQFEDRFEQVIAAVGARVV
jgi:hypothetical protein